MLDEKPTADFTTQLTLALTTIDARKTLLVHGDTWEILQKAVVALVPSNIGVQTVCVDMTSTHIPFI